MSSKGMETYVSVPQGESPSIENPRRRKSVKNIVIIILSLVIALGVGVAIALYSTRSSKNIVYVPAEPTTNTKTAVVDTKSKISDTPSRDRFDAMYNEIRDSRINLEKKTKPKVCRTNECHNSASALSNAMDLSVDPCGDFYNFVCGKWNNDKVSTGLSNSSAKENNFAMLTAKMSNLTIDILRESVDNNDPKSLNAVKDYFKRCKDVDQLEKDGLYPMYSVLESYGGWPLLYRYWNSSRFNFIKSMSGLQRIFSTRAIFDIRVNTKGAENVVEILQPSFFIPHNILLEPQKYSLVLALYLVKISSLVAEINASPDPRINHSKMLNRSVVIDEAYEIIRLETILAKAAKNLQTDGDGLVTVLEIPLRSLDAYFDSEEKRLEELYNELFNTPVIGVSLSLSQMVRTVFKDAGVTLTDTQTVRVIDVDYMEVVLELLKNTPKKTLADYLHLRMAYSMAPETTNNMTKIMMYRNATVNEREKSCSSFSDRNFGLSIAFKYVKNGVLSMKTKIDIQNMYEKIMSSFKELIETTTDWMSPDKHYTLTRKIDMLKACVGFPEWIENKTAIDVPFSRSNFFEIQTDMEEEFLKRHLKITEWQGNQKYKKLLTRENTDCEWAFHGIVNAFYDFQRNQILLPPGILQFPLFDQNRPESLNFGALGTIIGHELTHSYYSVDLSNSSIKGDKYEKTIKGCLVDQYNSVERLKLTEGRVNGQITFHENFADVGGLSAAYYSLIQHLNKTGVEEKLPGFEKYDSEQMFYISFAHNWCSSNGIDILVKQVLGLVHSPPRQRIVGALTNSKEFARAWKCPRGSPMNKYPTQKCDIF